MPNGDEDQEDWTKEENMEVAIRGDAVKAAGEAVARLWNTLITEARLQQAAARQAADAQEVEAARVALQTMEAQMQQVDAARQTAEAQLQQAAARQAADAQTVEAARGATQTMEAQTTEAAKGPPLGPKKGEREKVCGGVTRKEEPASRVETSGAAPIVTRKEESASRVETSGASPNVALESFRLDNDDGVPLTMPPQGTTSSEILGSTTRGLKPPAFEGGAAEEAIGVKLSRIRMRSQRRIRRRRQREPRKRTLLQSNGKNFENSKEDPTSIHSRGGNRGRSHTAAYSEVGQS